MTTNTIYRNAYQAPSFLVDTIALDIQLHEHATIVKSTMQLQRQQPGALCLHGDALELLEITLDGAPLPDTKWRIEEGCLYLDDCPDKCSLSLSTQIYPDKNTQLSGLYKSNGLYCTQCEAEGFRRITFFPDRPDVLSTFTTRISADKDAYPVLLSNGNLIDKGDLEDNRHFALWHDPFKKPSYLFALVAGKLDFIEDSYQTQSGRTVCLRIFVEPENIDKCDFAMRSLKKSMEWDEQVYGREYDLDIFMIVAVSDFNMGAMENKGLNIFNTKYILARPDTATDKDFIGIEDVVAHEYFHNWTGNRVTCRDWFQLSLKEGLTVFRDQEFSRDMNSRDVNRIQDVRLLRAHQFPEDAGSMAHPVRPESYEEINNFYTATIYNKGAEVIRMQHTLLGAEGFRRGMDLYFERHDGQAVTIDDFVASMEDANDRDLSQFKRWYSQAGTPRVEVRSHYDNGCLQIELSQSCKATADNVEKQPFHIPIRIALFDKNEQAIALDNDVLELTKSQQTFYFDKLSGEPTLSLLRDFSAPVQLDWSPGQDHLITLLRIETDGYAKWDAAQQLLIALMKECYAQDPSLWKLNAPLVDAFKAVLLDTRLDPGLQACLLTIPGFEEFSNQLAVVEVLRVEQVRKFIRTELAIALQEPARVIYQQLCEQEDHAINGTAFARRQLKNTCLAIMMHANEKGHIAFCEGQFTSAKTMSDQLAALQLLVNAQDTNAAKRAIAAFEKQWQHDELVMDKWFFVQASADRPDALEKVKALQQHKAFSMKNPNKVRSLIGAFCAANPKHFHAIDGSGYEFLYETLLALDAINSQIAARLATPFTRWMRYDTARQDKMQHYLKALNTAKLSKDLKEIVHKSLKLG